MPEQQEHLLTSQTKALVDHAPTNIYIVNMSTLHNYQYIKATISKLLSDQICVPFIADHVSLKLRAADLLRSKKGKDTSDATPSHGEGSSTEWPAFESMKKTRGKGKGKALAPEPPPQLVRETANAGPSHSSNPHAHVQTLIAT